MKKLFVLSCTQGSLLAHLRTQLYCPVSTFTRIQNISITRTVLYPRKQHLIANFLILC